MMDRFRCAQFVVQDAINRGAELIVHCGDVGNHWHWTPTITRLAKQVFAPALECGIPVVVLEGNHDQVRNPSEYDALDLLRDLPGLTVVDKPTLLDVWRAGRDDKLRVTETSSATQGEAELQLAGLPYPSANLLLRDEDTRKLGPGDRNLLIRQKMMDCARGLAADRVEGVPRVLLGHWSVDMATAGTQNRLMMLGGEFTLNAHELEALGFDAVLLGHIHKPQQVLADGQPLIVYSGSPEACSFGEEGEEKRYCLWDIDKQGAEEFHGVPTPFRKLVTLTASDFQVSDDGSDWECEPFPDGAIVRLELPPDSPITVAQALQTIEEAGAFEARVTKARAETERRRETDMSHGMALPEQIDEWLKGRPDYLPHRDALVAEALKIEEAVSNG